MAASYRTLSTISISGGEAITRKRRKSECMNKEVMLII
jgi:hypothetical protein